MVHLRNEVVRRREEESIPRFTPKGDSKANGVIEKGVQALEGQIRVIKLGLERRIQHRIGQDWDVLHWVVELAAIHLSRYERGSDGMTPYRRLTGRDWNQAIMEFGELVEYKPQVQKREEE